MSGTEALWSSSKRAISCTSHEEANDELTRNLHNDPPLQQHEGFKEELNRGTAGGSAKAENERRIKKREKQITARFPRVGKYILALTDEPQSTQAWKIGAEGEIAIPSRHALVLRSNSSQIGHCIPSGLLFSHAFLHDTLWWRMRWIDIN